MTKRFNFRGTLSVVAVAALLAGCSLIPIYERPTAPVPTTFPSDPAQPAGPAAATVPWQDYFADPRLQGLIQTALANNRDLRVSVLNIEQARAQFQIQRSALFPAVGVSASGSRSSPNALQAFGVGGSVSSNYSVNLGITAWELDFFGRIGSLKEQALAQYLSTEESRKAAQISLIAAVANGWLTLIADDELLELTRQTLGTREESVRLTKLRFENGVVSEIDYQLANSQAENARATYAQQQRLRAQDENALALLLGAPVPAQALAGGALRLDAAAPMRDLPAGLPSDLLIERPDIRAAEQQLIAANASIGAARANFFPRISLTTSVGTASSEFSNLFDKGTKAWSFAPSITLPIFNAGANQATLDSARAGQQIAVAQYEKSIQTAFSEVADALAGRATLGEQVRALRAQADAEGVRFKLSDLRYRNGIASALDLLDAQRSLFAAQQAAVQTRLLQLQNQVLLYRALGGGWTSR
ncbi:efflux transporter outer membrane subunit [Variovorax sp. ZT4R33]|uniref:efflux transporter outer membrane subunit n=1 Tax=Variovorax sp. ZT4R33 TaxID=3443743 RepID=UPI003F462FC4